MDKIPQAGRSNEEIVEGRNFFCDSETIEIIYSMMDEARREAVAEKDRVIAELNLALNEAEKKIKQLDTKPY